MRQEKGTNLCAYYVCENIRFMTERSGDARHLWVRKHYSQFFYDDLIYIHTTNIFILISFFKDGDEMRDRLLPKDRIRALQEEIAGFLLTAGHISRKRRIPLHLMPACNDLQIVGEIVYTKLYIYIYVYAWSYEKFYDI